MHASPSGRVEGLSYLLEQWVATVDRDRDQNIARLHFMWTHLFVALTGGWTRRT